MVEAVTVVLVEGASDRAAVEATAEALGRDLAAAGVIIQAMGGATSIGHFVNEYGPTGSDLNLVGLCDAPERRYFARHLDDHDIYVCDADLEDELLRAMGIEQMVDFIESQGELKRFRTMQKQPHQRDRSIEHHLHNYCGIRAGRKARYARGIVEWLPAAEIPEPLQRLVVNL